MKQTAHLENWFRYSNFLRGIVSNHPKIEDGKEIVTSLLISFNGETAETMNTVYTLGKPYES